MAIFDCRFRSPLMGRDMPFMLVVPNEGSPYKIPGLAPKLVFCLHGIGGDYRECASKLPLELVATTFNLTFVLPQGDRSFFLNGFYPYEDAIVQDLVPYLTSHFILPERKDWMVMGISMGGYGAMSLISKHPDLFHKACCLSPCLDYQQILSMAMDEKNRCGHEELLANYYIKEREYSDPGFFKFEGGPEIMIACGTEDPFYPGCLTYEKKLREEGLSVQSLYKKGSHNWFFWNKRMVEAGQFLQGLPIGRG